MGLQAREGDPMLPEPRLGAPPAAAARRPPSRAALPPGPRRPPLLQSLRYVRRPYEAVAESGRRWGNCFTARALGQPPTVIFAAPEAIKDIFMGDPDELRGGEGNAWVLGPILGWHSLLVLANGSAAAFLFIPALRIDLGRFSPWGRFVRDRRDLAAILLAAIAGRRREGTAGRSDVLSMLIEARDEHGEPMRDEELLDEMFTLLMAGPETTATSPAWGVH